MVTFTKQQKIMVGVIAFYLAGSVMQNVLATKTFDTGGISPAAAGILLTPLVFACSDIMTEVLGKKVALRICYIGAGVNIVWAIVCQIAIAIPGNNEFMATAFAAILGSTLRITVASIIAYIGGSWINNSIMDSLHKKEGAKGYYKRAILSTFLGQMLDDYAFCFLAFAPFGISPIENPWNVIALMPFLSAVLETIIEACVTPISKKIAYAAIDKS